MEPASGNVSLLHSIVRTTRRDIGAQGWFTVRHQVLGRAGVGGRKGPPPNELITPPLHRQHDLYPPLQPSEDDVSRPHAPNLWPSDGTLWPFPYPWLLGRATVSLEIRTKEGVLPHGHITTSADRLNPPGLLHPRLRRSTAQVLAQVTDSSYLLSAVFSDSHVHDPLVTRGPRFGVSG